MVQKQLPQKVTSKWLEGNFSFPTMPPYSHTSGLNSIWWRPRWPMRVCSRGLLTGSWSADRFDGGKKKGRRGMKTESWGIQEVLWYRNREREVMCNWPEVIYRKAVRSKHGWINTLGGSGANRNWGPPLTQCALFTYTVAFTYTAHSRLRTALLYFTWFQPLHQCWKYYQGPRFAKSQLLCGNII